MSLTAAQSLNSFVTLGKVFNFFDPQFPHLYNGYYDNPVLGVGII